MDKKVFTIPNIVSLLRLFLLIPLVQLFSYINDDYNYRLYLLLFLIFIFLTDNLDGFLARRLNQISELGKIIDPLADKVIIITVVIFLYIYDQVPEYYFFMVIIRDIYIFLGAAIISRKIGKVPPSNMYGKAAMALMSTFMLWSILDPVKDSVFYNFLLYTSIIFIFASAFTYTIRGIKFLKNNSIDE